MAKININKDKCKGCMLCVTTCSQGLITQSKKLNRRGLHCVEFRGQQKCTGCSMCAVICPDVCIEVYR